MNLNLQQRYKTTHSLNPEELEELGVYIQEAQNRGLSLPDDFSLNPAEVIPLGSNGYYVKNDGTLYIPTESQGDFIDDNSRFSSFIGGRGSGKTAAGIQKALKKIAKGYDGAIINPDFENFRYSTWREVRNWFPVEMVIPRHRYMFALGWKPTRPFELTCITGATVYCKGLKDPDSARGPNINWFWYDEGGRDPDGLGWRLAVASVRVGHEPQSWTTATPNGKGHWMYQLFAKRKISEEALKIFAEVETRELVSMFKGSISDNKENLDPGFYASLLATYTGWMKLQELDGIFVDQGGILGDPDWFKDKVLKEIPEKEPIKKRVRYWDLAATEKKIIKKRKIDDPDYTVGTLMSWNGKGKADTKFFLEDQVSGQWKYENILDAMWATFMRDSPQVPIYIEQEPAAGGINQIAAIDMWFKQKCEMFGVAKPRIIGDRPSGDKISRANPWFEEARAGKIYLIEGKWNEKFLSVLSSFPIVDHDDEIDSISGARKVCAPWITWTDMDFLHL